MNSIRISLLATFTVLSHLITAIVLAQPAAAAVSEDEQELERLIRVLDEQTELATKSRLNADFVPGIVTVLRGADLQLRGVRNVWEALSLVPGMEQGIEESGRRHILIRGVGLTYASESAKIMVNGVSYNTTTFAFADAVFSIPIEQVERIEVIRGPGSAVYGEFAYAGVINVITYQEGSSLFAKGTSHQERLGGGIFSFGEVDGQGVHGTLNVAAENSGKGGVASGYDSAYMIAPSFSYAPGESNEVARARSAMLDLGYREYSVKLAWLNHGYGDHFGINNYLPPDAHLVTTDRFSTIELSRAITWSSNTKGRVSVGQRTFSESKDRLFVEKTTQWCNEMGSACIPPLPDDIVVDLATRETARYATADMQWKGSRKDTLYVEFSYTDVKLDDHTQSINVDPNTWEPLSQMVAWDTLLTAGVERHIFSATLQDEHRITEGLLATMGIRYDHYSDVGSSLTPRLAGVWTINQNHLIKAQFSSAFRPPTFYELAGAAETIEPATVDTYELSYIARHHDSIARITGYYSRMEKVIGFSPMGYTSGDSTLRGVELEYDRKLTNRLRVDGNLSVMSAYDNVSTEPLPKAAMRLANLALIYTPVAEILLNTQFRYVGPRSREVGDTREELKGYQTLDFTLSRLNTLTKGATLQAGVRNITDADILYPASAGTYPDDYPRPGRYWWLGIQYNYN